MSMNKIPDSFVKEIGKGNYAKTNNKKWLKLEKLAAQENKATQYNKIAIPYRRDHSNDYYNYLSWSNKGYLSLQKKIKELSKSKIDELWELTGKGNYRGDMRLFITVYVHKRYWNLKR